MVVIPGTLGKDGAEGRLGKEGKEGIVIFEPGRFPIEKEGRVIFGRLTDGS
jgi:hypothetical protein